MQFCDKCGSYLKKTPEGLVCRKCGKVIQIDADVQPTDAKKTEKSSSIHVVTKRSGDYVKALALCPKCGNGEAFHWFSAISGEHAGIGRETTIEHFECAKCSHTWTKVS